MAISFDAATTISWTSDQSSRSFAHTCDASASILLICISREESTDADRAVSTVTYNGSSCTQAGQYESDIYNQEVDIYYILNPSSGSNTVEVNFVGNVNYGCISAISLFNTRTDAGVIGASATGYSLSSSPSLTVTTESDNSWIIDTWNTNSGSADMSTGEAGQTERFEEDLTQSRAFGSTRTTTTAGDYDMSWTGGSGIPTQLGLGIEIKAATTISINVNDSVTVTDKPVYYDDTVIVWEDVTVELSTPVTDLNTNVNDSVSVVDSTSTLVLTTKASANDSVSIAEDVTVYIQPYPDEPSVADAVTVAESVTLSFKSFINVNDSVSIAEDITVYIQPYPDEPSVADTVTVAENVDISINAGVSVNDSVSIAEDVTVYIQPYPNETSVSDSVTVAESVSCIVSSEAISVSDSVTVAEDVTVSIGTAAAFEVSVNDSVSVAEDVTVSIGTAAAFEVSVSDSVSVAEDVTVSIGTATAFEVSVSDSVSVAEDVTVSIGTAAAFEVSVNDSVSVAEDVTVSIGTAAAFEVSVSDSVTVAESVSCIASGEAISVSDSVSVAEDVTVSISAIASLNITKSDSISLTEDIGVQISTSPASVNDSVSVAEDVTVSIGTAAAFEVSVNDSVSVAEDVTVSIGTAAAFEVSVSDSVTVAESVSCIASGEAISVSDSVSVAEDVTVSIGATAPASANVSDSVTITENIGITVSECAVYLSEDILVSELISVSIAGPKISVNDSVSVSEGVNVSKISKLSVYEAITVNENVAVTVSGIEISVNDNVSVLENVSLMTTWYDTSWIYRIRITVDKDKVISSQTNFPVYVDLSDLPSSFHTHVKSDGGDIRMTTDDGTTEIARELVFYDDGTDTGELHFKAPSLSSSVDTDFYLYYGNSGASDYAIDATYGAENVWTNSYAAVYHMQEDPTGSAPQIIDSTSNAQHCTAQGSWIAGNSVAGKLSGKSLDFDGNDEYIDDTDASAMPDGQDARTISLWSNPDSFPSGVNSGMVQFGNGPNPGQRFIFQAPSLVGGNYYLFTDGINVANNITITGAEIPTTTAWNFMVFKFDGSTDWEYWLNGASTATKSGTYGVTINTALDDFQIGARIDGTTGYHTGQIDEVRIATVERSGDWTRTEYNNQSSSSTFYSVGSEEEIPQEINLAANDTITVSEDISVSIGNPTPTPNTNDSVSVSENVSVSIITNIDTYENITVNEYINIIFNIDINTSDSVSISENVKVLIRLSPSVYDEVLVSENTNILLPGENIMINVNDNINVEDTSNTLISPAYLPRLTLLGVG